MRPSPEGDAGQRLDWTEDWQGMIVRGLFGVGCGLVTFSWPHVTLAVLVAVLGAYLFVEGVFRIVPSTRAHDWLGVAGAVLRGVAAIAVFSQPALVLLVMLGLFASLVVLIGLGVLLSASRGPNRPTDWSHVVTGLGLPLLGVVAVLYPRQSLVVAAYLIGAFAFGIGGFLLASGLRTVFRRRLA